jgi:hypothetical protein
MELLILLAPLLDHLNSIFSITLSFLAIIYSVVTWNNPQRYLSSIIPPIYLIKSRISIIHICTSQSKIKNKNKTCQE